MKKPLLLVACLFIIMIVLAAACAPQKTGQTAAQTITGEIVGISVPLSNAPTELTVKTPQGQQTIQLAANTSLSLDGQACPIEDLGQTLQSGKTTYNCTVVIDPCQPGIVAQYISLYTVTR